MTNMGSGAVRWKNATSSARSHETTKGKQASSEHVRDVLSRKQVRLFDLDAFRRGWLGRWDVPVGGRRGHRGLKGGPERVALSKRTSASARADTVFIGVKSLLFVH